MPMDVKSVVILYRSMNRHPISLSHPHHYSPPFRHRNFLDEKMMWQTIFLGVLFQLIFVFGGSYEKNVYIWLMPESV
ncbi:hypothetical protein Hanom_Chr07g00603341 [Helianthus anomalus]